MLVLEWGLPALLNQPEITIREAKEENMGKRKYEPTPDGGMEFREIAERLGVTHQCVHQIYQRAIKKLRRNPRIKQMAKELGIKSQARKGANSRQLSRKASDRGSDQ